MKDRKDAVEAGRVLARVLSRDEVVKVSGGVVATDSWKDGGPCTPKSDPGAA